MKHTMAITHTQHINEQQQYHIHNKQTLYEYKINNVNNISYITYTIVQHKNKTSINTIT